MGSFFTDILSFQHETAVFDVNPHQLRFVYNTYRFTTLEEIKDFEPELVINAATVRYTLDAFRKVLPVLPKDCIISDIASVKTGLKKFYEESGFRYVSSHPMFGPTFASLSNLSSENAIIISEGDHLGKIFFKDLYQTLRLNIFEYTFDEHDETVAYSLSIPFVSTFVFAAVMTITSRLIPFYGQNYVVFYFSSSKVPFATSKYGVQYLSKKDVENTFYNSFYNVTGAIGGLQATVEQMTQTDFPIMIIGEAGTGKERVAGAVYTQSPLHHNPMVVIDFTMMNDKSWTFLTNHYNSPFNDNNNTIYLKNVDTLPEERHKQLLSLIVDMNLARRNRLLFSCVCGKDGVIPKRCMDYVNMLSCLTIHLPPLRERREEIPVLANLSLSSLNISLAKEILGLESGAMELLVNYEWPYNYTQFKRILSELTAVTTTPYILESTVAHALEQEHTSAALLPHSGIQNPVQSFNLNRTLDEINQDIIHAVLEETGGNQSAAAKRLGISRTTLWRLLKS